MTILTSIFKKIGLKCSVAAQITGYDSATGAPTYGNGFIIGKAVTAEKTIGKQQQ